jgi:exopolysaccharide biosynthesis polyprenyl glycosylphosphotransferase
MTQRMMGFEPTLAPDRTVARPSVVAVPAQDERVLSRAVPRWIRIVGADAVAVAASTVAVLTYWGELATESAAVVAVTVGAFLAALAVSGSYGRKVEGVVVSRRLGRPGVLSGLPLGVVLASLATRAVPGGLALEQAGMVAMLGLATIPAARALVPALVMPQRRVRRVLILGSGRMAARVLARLRRRPGVSVVGVVDEDPDNGSARLSNHELPELCARLGVDTVVVAFSRMPVHETVESLRGLEKRVSVWVVPRLYEMVTWRSVIEELDGIPLIDVAPAQVGPAARAGKRIFDVVVAGTLLVALSPLFAVVAAAIKLTSPGPVMFRQFRSGQHREPFRMYKFRTMGVDAEEQRAALAQFNHVDGPIFKMKDDPRVTRVGAWLRKTSLDELPQLINVLRGEMSLVGPRPFPIDESEKITGWATIRFSVPPGMTGLWQVSGRNALDYDDLRHLDYAYVASWSFAWDLRILLQTPATVLLRRGVL